MLLLNNIVQSGKLWKAITCTGYRNKLSYTECYMYCSEDFILGIDFYRDKLRNTEVNALRTLWWVKRQVEQYRMLLL